MKLPPIKWRKLLKETFRYVLATASFGCVVASRVLLGNASVIAEAGGLFLGLVYLQVSPRFFQSWKNLNQSISALEQQAAGIEELISIRQSDLHSIEETIAAQEEVSRMRMDALLAADRMELSEREAEVAAREQAVEADELELNDRLEALRTKTLDEARLTLERERLQFEQQCEQELAELAERKANLEESELVSIAEIEELEAQKNKEIADFHERQQFEFEEECKQRDAEYKAAKKEFLLGHAEQIEQLKAKIEQLESELAHAANTIAQLQESFPEDLEPHTIAARAIRDVLLSQRINSQYKHSYEHDDGSIVVRLRIDNPLSKIKPYLAVIQQRLRCGQIALTIAKGGMQFAFTPDSVSVSAKIEDSSNNNFETVPERKFEVLEEPLDNFLAFLKVMEDPLVPIDPRQGLPISIVERNWVLKLWVLEKKQNQRHVCGIVYQARSSGDNRRYTMAVGRVRQILDAYGIQYQVRKKSKIREEVEV